MAEMRVSDSDRERTVDLLRAAAGEGRLDSKELEERVAAAYAAKTDAELAALSRDLPPLPVPAPPRTPIRQDRHVRERLAGFITANAICIAIWAATGAGSFWPIWVILGTGIGLFSTLVHKGLGVEPRHHEHRHRPRHR